MATDEYRVALQFRILYPHRIAPAICPFHPECKVSLDIMSYHSLSCAWGKAFDRHQTLVFTLSELSSISGIQCRVNPKHPVPQLNSTIHFLRPGDLMVLNDRGADLAIDVTIVNPLSEAKANTSYGSYTGHLASKAAMDKIIKHADSCSCSGLDFIPFAVDVCGVLDQDAFHFLLRIANAYALRNNMTPKYARSIILRRVSFSLQRSIARQIITHCNYVPSSITL
jgi:hypothetical protein